MRIVILPKTYDLKDWMFLYTILITRYPDAGAIPRLINGEVRMVLVVPEHELIDEDREFLNSISRPYIGPQGDIPDEMYRAGRNRKWLMNDWYDLDKSTQGNK